mgnify:CR=1 FL=1
MCVDHSIGDFFVGAWYVGGEVWVETSGGKQTKREIGNVWGKGVGWGNYKYVQVGGFACVWKEMGERGDRPHTDVTRSVVWNLHRGERRCKSTNQTLQEEGKQKKNIASIVKRSIHVVNTSLRLSKWREGKEGGGVWAHKRMPTHQ